MKRCSTYPKWSTINTVLSEVFTFRQNESELEEKMKQHLMLVFLLIFFQRVRSSDLNEGVQRVSNSTDNRNDRCKLEVKLQFGADWNRNKRLNILVLSLFSIVRFANSFCYGNNGLNGTCFTSVECSKNGGTASGSCAQGFGVCCTSKLSRLIEPLRIYFVVVFAY